MKRIVKLMKIISNQIDAKMQILLADTDLTSSQVIILQYLINHECLNQKQLCATFKLSSATVNGILNRLEDKGYIEREKSDDKRNNRIILTSKALAINEKFMKAVTYNDSILSNDFTADEIDNLFNLLSKMLKNIEEGKYDKNII